MIRKIAISTATAALTVVIAASSAGADPGSYDTFGIEIVKAGTGSASADAAADPFGQMTAESSATGGSKRGLLGTKTKLSSGTARATVTEGYALTAGTFEVRVTVSGAQTSESASGNGTATGLAASSTILNTGLFEPTVLGEAETDLTGTSQTVTLTYQITLQRDGFVGVQAEVQALSTAKGNGNSASTESSSQAVTFSVQPID